MAAKVIMPKLGVTMTEGAITKWHKNIGEKVVKGEVIFTVESDKTTFDVEAEEEGFIKCVLFNAGDVVPCAETIAIIGGENEDVSFVKRAETSSENQPNKDIKISPRARKLIREKNIDYEQIKGSGPYSRIIERDVISFLENKPKIKMTGLAKKIAAEKEIELDNIQGSGISGRIYAKDLSVDEKTDNRQPSNTNVIPYKGMRRIIGERLAKSKFTAPHLYFSAEIEMSKAIHIKKQFKEKLDEKISYNDMVVFAVSRALLKHPYINSNFIDEEIILHDYVNMGVAVALESGLIVPVIRDAHRKSLLEISKEAKTLAEKARTNKLFPDEYSGGTFTISNLGMKEVVSFTAIINQPEVAIMAVSKIKNTIVADNETEEYISRPIMNVTISVDHRVIDGMVAVRFLETVKEYLEEPYCLL